MQQVKPMPPTWHDEPMATIPANLEAEQAVLGSCLIDPEAFRKIDGRLTAKDFFREKHGWIFEAMVSLSTDREPIDTVTVCAALESAGKLSDLGGPAELTALIAMTPTAMYVEHYADIVADMSTRRRLISASGKVAELAFDTTTPIETVADKAQEAIMAASENSRANEPVSLGTLMQRAVNRIDELAKSEKKFSGLPTGFSMLDRLLGGLQASDLIILAARPGMGKSALVMNIALNACKKADAKVLVFSLEMSSEQLAQRLLSTETGIDSHRLRLGSLHDDEWPIMMEAANALATAKIRVDDTPAASIGDVRAKARRMYADEGLDLIVIDYLQLMTRAGNSQNREQEISFLSRSLKALARELDVPIIALSQLSRAVESRSDKRPMLSDLRESGAIEQDSDVVMFIYRDDYYDNDSEIPNVAEVIVAKHRHGSTGAVSLYFRKELTQFRDLEIQRTEFDY